MLMHPKTSQHMKECWENWGKTDISIVIVGNFNTPLSVMGRKSRYKFIKIQQTWRILYHIGWHLENTLPIRAQCTLFSNTMKCSPGQTTFWAMKQTSTNWKEVKLYDIFSDHSWMKLQIKNRKKCGEKNQISRN